MRAETEHKDYDLPAYRGLNWVRALLPDGVERWPRAGELFVGTSSADVEMSSEEVARYISDKPWVWPTETVNFLCDVHADAEAFLSSLVATGCVERTGPGDDDFDLAREARKALFVFGGDYFDKGPSNLRLLRALRRFVDRGARLELLAGNHDLRTMLGLMYAGAKDARHAHLFVRMGQKSLRLFKEVFDEYLAGSGCSLRSEADAREYLFPGPEWFDEFPGVAKDLVPPLKLAKELVRIREKEADIITHSAKMGLSLPMLLAALEKCRTLFLEPSGEFGWLTERMKLAYRAGSFLFVHAGLDDVTALALRKGGTDALNTQYRSLLAEDPFTLYNGPVGNSFRTKYRDIDFPFTRRGLANARRAGIYSVIHGHRNLLRGQRIMLRGGMLNFECDASVDQNTRRLVGLSGLGGAATIVRPQCHVLGVSTDHPHIKVFDPAALSKSATFIRPSPQRGRRNAGGSTAAPPQAG